MVLNMSLLKLWDSSCASRVHVLHNYTICTCQHASELCGSLGMLECMCVCVSAHPGMREYNTPSQKSDVRLIHAYICDVTLNDVWCDNHLDFHDLVANRHHIVSGGLYL
jgi:hypothetical protein